MSVPLTLSEPVSCVWEDPAGVQPSVTNPLWVCSDSFHVGSQERLKCQRIETMRPGWGPILQMWLLSYFQCEFKDLPSSLSKITSASSHNQKNMVTGVGISANSFSFRLSWRQHTHEGHASFLFVQSEMLKPYWRTLHFLT